MSNQDPDVGFRFSYPIRVRYHEVDTQRIVYNSVYLQYADIAFAEYMRNLGFGYFEGVAAGFDPSLVKATLEFRSPGLYDDALDVFARVSRLGNSSFTMHYRIQRQGETKPVLLAEIVYVNFDVETHSARPLPAFFREKVRAFEGTGMSDE